MQLKKERNAIILAHYYQRDEIQEVADFRGDSFLLAQKAAQTDADVIVFCGVHFMGESAKILAPNKTVIIPDERAGCPMADMVNVDGLRKLKAQHPNAKVVTYINSSAEIKAETDICCTSANAVKVVNSVDSDEIIWVPDKNLGHYVQQNTDKKMIIWEGYCNTHDMLTVKDVEEMRAKHPNAQFVVHPECRPEVVAMGDFVGSTTAIIKYCRESDCQGIHRRHGGRNRLPAAPGQPGQNVPFRDQISGLPEHESEQPEEARQMPGDDAAANLRAAGQLRTKPDYPWSACCK